MLRAVARHCLACAILASALSAAATGAAGPDTPSSLRAVSPGAADGSAASADPCPTFSWSSTASADRFALEVYDVDSQRRAPVLSVGLPGGARSWTPSADRCLESGRAYVWFVRSTVDGRPAGRSEARLLRIASRPSAEEIVWAQDVLRRHLEASSAPTTSFREPATLSSRLPADAGSSLLAAPAGTGLALDVEGTVEAREVEALAYPPTYAGDIDADGNIRAPGGAMQSPRLTVSRIDAFGDSVDSFTFVSPSAGVVYLCAGGSLCDGAPTADGSMRVGELTAVDRISVVPGGGMFVAGPYTWYGSGGSGFFTVPSLTVVRVDDNPESCSGGVVVGVRLQETDADQIGIQVKCSQ